LLTYVIYCCLVFFAPAQVAYAIVYALGIALAYAGHVSWVFRARPRVATAAIYPLLYFLQYSLTAGLLELLLQHWGLGERLALAVAIAIVTPLSFLVSRWVLQGDRDERRATRPESPP
jgi:putative flippase GtrA